MSGVSLKQVTKAYDRATQVIHGVDLEIAAGEFMVFVGPSGCGKSTLMRMIAGLESITGGTVAIGGRVVNDLPPRERDVAMVFQDYALYPHKNVYENLAFGLRLRKAPAAEIDARVKDAAKALKIDHLLERKPRALSGGQRQRVAMGRAIVRQPKLFLFDEPLSNLDAQLRGEVRTEIKKLHQRLGVTTIYVTHDQVEAMTLAQRIVVLSAGRIMQVGTPDEIYHRPASRFVAGFTGSPPMNFLSARATDAGGLLLGEGAALQPDEALAAKLKPLAGGAVVLGIRPEDVHAGATANTHTPIAAAVDVVEPLGAETLVTFTTAAGPLIARLSPSIRMAAGERHTVYLDLGRAHAFRADDGALIGSAA
ncbi:MAG: sn-glycerol-3-phosphate ABC transporter ATP-binding protein UgpC [Betaproteobacteria bacterium]|nr:sn-glycerol-3-phosphate ABC transporter ATP-binding protein UgpC [Betaproteobacteria bacterium]